MFRVVVVIVIIFSCSCEYGIVVAVALVYVVGRSLCCHGAVSPQLPLGLSSGHSLFVHDFGTLAGNGLRWHARRRLHIVVVAALSCHD